MCVDIEMLDHTAVRNVKDMRERDWVVLWEDLPSGWTPESDKYCLCGVNVEGILERNGIDYVESVWGWTEVALEPEDLPDDDY